MRKLSAFFLLLLSGSFHHSFAQNEQHYSVSQFEQNSGYAVEKIWLKSYQTPKVKITEATFSPTEDLPKGIQAKPLAETEIILGMERKRPFAIVRIPVYSIHEGKYRQLSTFNVEIEEPEAQSQSSPAAKTASSSSVLTTGTWYKIAISERGVYKIDFNFLKDKLGVNPSSINPSHIRIYGNGGEILSESNTDYRPDDLIENSIFVSANGSSFNQGDYVLFYANGPTKWMKDSINQRFYHLKNLYEDKSYYFINFDLGAGQRIANQQIVPSANITVTDFNDYMVHENDLVNLGHYGKEWWGEELSTEPGKQSSRNVSFNVGTLTDSAFIRTMFGSNSGASNNTFSIQLNGQKIGSFNFGITSERPIISQSAQFKLPVSGTTASFQLDYSPGISTAKAYLNYLELNTRRLLAFSGAQFTFRDWKSIGASNNANYKIQNANNNITVWDITDPLRPERMNGSLSGGNYSFTQSAQSLREFIAFDGSQFNAPEFVKKVDNQNLHGSSQVDYIIISHPNFLEAANKLADFHRQKDGLRTIVATTEQVYNEFGSGSQDISAIRDFARMFYKRAGTDTTEMPRYLLLFGDASYDYKNRLTNNNNYVPTWETSESIDIINSFCSDDFFGLLDDNENIGTYLVANTLDLGVGRIPVNSASSAMAVVDKIINYTQPSSLGPWRLSTTIMTDNIDNGWEGHFQDGEAMAKAINQHTNLYNETKVHLSALPVISTPGGTRSPEANKIINDQVFKGTFLMNYSGHGSIATLASERIVTMEDFNTWKNKDKLPIIITATCDYGKFDEPLYPTSAELLMLKADGGAIALFTTSQKVYQNANHITNYDFLDVSFQRHDGKWLSPGDAFRYSKNRTYEKAVGPQYEFTLQNCRKFILLGDPALKLAFPEHKIQTEAIVDENGQAVDTMKALGKYQIKGSVKDANDNLMDSFEGRVYVTIYDKPKTVSLLTTPSMNYEVQNNVIYKGKATVSGGKFSISFVAPKDLNYDFGKGKISLYAENGITDAAGADTTVTIGGFSDNPTIDNDGPIVKPFINDSLFRDGGITGSNTLLYVQLSDETGINVSGNSFGHDLTAVLDDDFSNPYILNDYYETAPNDYTKGFVYFPISGLSEGRHRLRVKAWDVNNNSGEGVVNFEVVNGGVVRVQNLMNYPNPFRDFTHFVFEHNHPNEDLNVHINIYSSSGYKVRTLKQTFTPEGSRTNEIKWDGTDDNGVKLPSGIYVYRINIATDKGIQATAYQKLVLVR